MAFGKKSMIFLLLLFLAPMVLGTVFFMNSDRMQLGKDTTNYGTLLQPPIQLSADQLLQNGTPADTDKTLRGKWTILYLTPEDCTAECEERLDLIKRVRLLNNEDMLRVRTVAVSPKPLSTSKDIKQAWQDLIPLTDSSAGRSFSKDFPGTSGHTLYLVDPLGFLMMYYDDPTIDVKRIMGDFKRLLKYSKIG